MKKIIKGIIFATPGGTLLLYGAGFISQLMYNYGIWKELGGGIGATTSPTLPSTDFLTCLSSIFRLPYGLYGIGICVMAVFLFVVFVMRVSIFDKRVHDKKRNITYSDKGAYGTSGVMTDEEMKKVFELTKDLNRCRGTILGKFNGKTVCLPEKTRMNRNIAVYGAPGSMKSRAFARNMIFQCVRRGESLIITDPKSELFETMSQYLRDNGYIVRVFNLVNPENSDSWNCLFEIEGQEIMAQLFTDVVIKNTGSLKGDHFWDNSEQSLLKALCLYVEQGYPPESKNIGEVYKLLTNCTDRQLNSMFDVLPLSHPAKAPYSIFRQASDSVRGGIIIGLGSRIQVFQNKLIRDITGTDEIDLTLPGKKKCAYFCITSDQDSTFDFLSSLFLSFLFIKLVRYADKYGDSRVLPVPVHILADELANIGVIPDLTKKTSTIRSRGISMSIIFQSLAQMQHHYPQNQWQELLGSCDTQLFLGCTDEITARFISDRSGEITIEVDSTSKRLSTMRVTNWTPEFRETSSIGRRKLLTPDEVLRLPLDKALIILRGQKLLEVDKFDYTLHPESKKMKPIKVRDYVPKWRTDGDLEKISACSHIQQDSMPEKLNLYEVVPTQEKEKTISKVRGKKKNVPITNETSSITEEIIDPMPEIETNANLPKAEEIHQELQEPDFMPNNKLNSDCNEQALEMGLEQIDRDKLMP